MDQITETKLRKPRGQGGSRRGEILAAAKHLFAEEGVDHVTMRRIAGVVGVSPTALYMHFADKDAMLAAIAQDTFGELLERLEQSQTEGQTLLGGFRAGLRAYIKFGLERPDEYRLTFMARLFDRARARTCALEMADHSFAILQNHIMDLIAKGVFRGGHPPKLAEAVWAMLHGVTALVLDQAANLDTDPAALIETALDLLECGLIARP